MGDGLNGALFVLGVAIVATCGTPAVEVPKDTYPPVLGSTINLQPQSPRFAHDTEGEHLLTLVLLGEVAHKPAAEVRAIIGVVLNRLASGRYGNTLEAVVMYNRHGVYAFTCLDPVRANPRRNVFAPWLPRSAEYKRLNALVRDGIEHGPNHLYTHYWHPDAMVPLGSVPRWAQGKTAVRIGSAMFVKG